jgi:transcriptional regulator with XRE-family HTH domain
MPKSLDLLSVMVYNPYQHEKYSKKERSKSLRNWLPTARKEKKLKQVEVAKALNLKVPTYSRMENNTRIKRLPLLMAVELSDLLGLSLEEIARNEREEE